MKLILIIGIILFSLLLLLFFLLLVTKSTIHIRYYHKKDSDDLTIEVKLLFGLIRYKKKIPLIKIDDNSPTIVVKEETKINESQEAGTKKTKQFSAEDLVATLENAKEILWHVVGFHRIIRSFLSKVTIKNIEWSSIVGLGDAAHTGAVSGALWAVKGGIIGIISQYMRMQNMPKINIYPQFQRVASETLFTCMFQFRIGHAMFAGIKIIKFWKGGFPQIKSTDTTTSVQK
ncbi:DUF2953 domain-containing protein [Niallia sp. NCCP-28]|uniref:DUF2953 domain-containing protein n=1 Tax=Niallia sp. NCCP-28 TaxID=2934712 RepID=UPI0020853ACD|nr:DUF2953 domain-containing protein [Niallia sp. NCCP-28]GKU81571.1 hypothetical protein NCCP28_09670 [Niallia sp. NCCP-28]